MPETAPPRTPPTLLPLLSRGRHRHPSYGACFMEYTALLAGEPFSDRPECVDPTLAAILRGANDVLPDEERPRLVPLLGRAIGLVVPADDERGRSRRLLRLHARVCDKLRTAVAGPTSPVRGRRYRRHAGVSETFWDLMDEPTRTRTAREYGARLVERLELLHRCYEDALAELGVAQRSEPAATSAVPDQALLSA